MPPTIAQVVSRSPSPATVFHNAPSNSNGCRATLHSTNGTVSGDEMRSPLPRTDAADRGDASGSNSSARSIPSRVAPTGVRSNTAPNSSRCTSKLVVTGFSRPRSFVVTGVSRPPPREELSSSPAPPRAPNPTANAAATAIAIAPAIPSGWA
ncbi:MAG: hypothetical protein WD066_02870 [Planctomycetaceae bacterium]